MSPSYAQPRAGTARPSPVSGVRLPRRPPAPAQCPSSASTASTRRLSSSLSGRRSFWKIACTWRSTARGLRKSCLAIARFERPSAISERTSRSRSVSSSSSERAAPADEALDDLRVEGRAAGRDALDGVDELGDVAHAVLEQVADARGVVADELEHVGRLEVLGEDEHRDGRMGAADLRRGDQPVVGVARRHPDVDDRDVGRVGAHLQHQVVGVVRAPDHVVARVLSSDAMPSRSSALSSATTTRRRCGRVGRRTVGGCNVA